MPSSVSLKFVNPANGAVIGFMPDHKGLSAQVEYNGPGSISFQYVSDGENAALLDRDDAVIYIEEGGVTRDDAYLLEDDGDDPNEPPGRLVSVGGRGTLALLERALVYSREHRAGDSVEGLDPHFYFIEPDSDPTTDDATHYPTPGHIMLTLLRRAHNRGAIEYVTTDFDSDFDSAGRQWPEDYTVTIDAGTSLAAVLQNMTDQGWCDAQMVGTTLRMFRPDGSMYQDRPAQVIRKGREVITGPRKRSRRDIRTVMLGIGDEGAAAEAVDPDMMLRYDRREGYVAQSGVTALDTLRRVTRKSLALVSDTAEGFTVEIDPAGADVLPDEADGETVPEPFVDFGIGDFIRYDQRRLDERNLEPMRVRSVTTNWGDDGGKGYSFEFNDLFMERSVRLARQVEGITNGSSNNTRVPHPPPGGQDRIAPRAPASVSISSDANTKGNDVVATAVVSWPDVDLNADGSVFDDFQQYVVQIQFPDRNPPNDDWTGGVVVHEPPVAYYHDLPPGQRIKARVRAVDQSGNRSDWTESPLHTLATDATPPPQPGAPSVEVLIGGLRIGWDGLGALGQPMPEDFARCVVHVSTLGMAFAVSDATKAGSLVTKGFITLDGLDTALTYYVRLTLVDKHGNESPPGPTVAGQPRKVVSDDLADLILRMGSLADLERASITTTFMAPFEAADDRWSDRASGATLGVVASSAAVVGADVGEWTGPALWEFSDNIPFDPEQMYRVQARVRAVPPFTVSDNVSVGLAAYAADGVTHVGADDTQGGEDHYAAAYNSAPAAAGAWTTVQGFVKGRAAGASAPGAATFPSQARQLAASARFVRPVFRTLGNAGTVWEVDQFIMELVEIPPNFIGTVMIADATIVNSKIANAAIDDAKIGTLSVTTLAAGNLRADTIITQGKIRTAPATDGSNMVMDALGIHAFGATTKTFDVDSATGNVLSVGQLQAGRDNQAHVSLRSDPETGTGRSLDVADRVPSVRFWTMFNNERQPAVLKSTWDDVADVNSVPTFSIRSPSRQNSAGTEGQRSSILVRGGIPSARGTQVDVNANFVTFSPDPGGAAVNVRFSSGNAFGDAGGVPVVVGVAAGQELRLTKDGVRAYAADNTGRVLVLNDNAADVEIANRLTVRQAPAGGLDGTGTAEGQLLPANAAHPCSIVFGSNGLVKVMNRPGGAYQAMKVRDLIQTNPGAGVLLAGAAAAGADADVDHVAEVESMTVVEYQQEGKGAWPQRAVQADGLPAVLRQGAGDSAGVSLGGVVATLVAAVQQLAATNADLAARIDALESA